MRLNNIIKISMEKKVMEAQPSEERYEDILQGIFKAAEKKSSNPIRYFISSLRTIRINLPIKDTVEVIIFIAILIIIPVTFNSIKKHSNVNPVTIENNISGKNIPDSNIPKQNNNDDNLNTFKAGVNPDIKINGIYKLNIIGTTPKTIVLKPYDYKGIRAKIGVITSSNNGYLLNGRFDFLTDLTSSIELKDNASILDKRIIQEVGNQKGDTVDINKLVLVYYEQSSVQETPHIVAYSKIIDLKHRTNNIQSVRFEGKVESTDALIDAVAVIKDNENYKLVSGSTTYNVVGTIPKEMAVASIPQPEGNFPSIDINKLFVVYMTSLKTSKSKNGVPVWNVEVLTYSPVTGGEPVNMSDQGINP